MPKNIILIDKRVQDYETIVAAVDPDICIPVLFDYYTDTIADIKARIIEAVAADAGACVANDTPLQYNTTKYARRRTRRRTRRQYDVSNIPSLVSYN